MNMKLMLLVLAALPVGCAGFTPEAALLAVQASTNAYFFGELPGLDEAKTCDRRTEALRFIAVLDSFKTQAQGYLVAVDTKIDANNWDCVPDQPPAPGMVGPADWVMMTDDELVEARDELTLWLDYGAVSDACVSGPLQEIAAELARRRR